MRTPTKQKITPTKVIKQAASKDTKLDDLLRRIDHHAFVVRTVPTDFFKTAFLVQAGSLITILTLIVGHYPDPRSFPIELKGITQRVSFNIAAGSSISAIGYTLTFMKAHTSVRNFRAQINRHLFDGEDINISEKENIYYFLSLVLLALLVFASFTYDIIQMITIIDKIMPDYTK